MKINQIISETTTSSGAIAPVTQSFVKMQTRNPVVSSEKGNDLLTGKVTKKKYANSVSEGKRKNKVEEAKLEEDDVIIVPGHGGKRKNGLIPHGQSRVDHEVEMARSDVLSTMKNAKSIYLLLKDKSEEEGIEGWVQEKLIKANDYLNAVKEYYDEKMMQQKSGVDEEFKSKQQAKLMYAVAGDKDVAEKTGVSQKVAKEFIKKSHGQKVSKLPKKVKKG